MRAFLCLVTLSLLLTACSAPGLPPSTPTVISSPTSSAATETSTASPTSEATGEAYDYSTFNVADKSTWPADMKVAYDGLANRPVGADATTQEQFKQQDEMIHLGLMKGLVNFLKNQGMDMSKYIGMTADQLKDLNTSNEITTALGNWQKAYFEKTGQEASLMPFDPYTQKTNLAIDPIGAGFSTNKVPFFGEKITRNGLIGNSSIFAISTLMVNPSDQEKSAIIIAKYPNGSMRPFLVYFEDKIIDSDQFAFVPGGIDGVDSVLTLKELNGAENKLDLNQSVLTIKQLDGSSPVKSTEPLLLNNLFLMLGKEIAGYQTVRVDVVADLNGSIEFQLLFDKNGLEIISGIMNPDGTIILPSN